MLITSSLVESDAEFVDLLLAGKTIFDYNYSKRKELNIWVLRTKNKMN